MTDGCTFLSGHYHLQPSADCTLMLPRHQHMTHLLSMPGQGEMTEALLFLSVALWGLSLHQTWEESGKKGTDSEAGQCKIETQGMKRARYNITVWDRKVVVVWVRILRAQCASWAEIFWGKGAMDSPVRNLIHSHKFFQFVFHFSFLQLCVFTPLHFTFVNMSLVAFDIFGLATWCVATEKNSCCSRTSLRHVHLQTLKYVLRFCESCELHISSCVDDHIFVIVAWQNGAVSIPFVAGLSFFIVTHSSTSL